tara:strand:+ start:4283 stop:4690 length:408 start_codon:yes stop_codon:yes gene_type:complete
MAGQDIPSNILEFERVKDNENGSMGSFGLTWNNISRPGLNEQRFIRTGNRGSVQTVTMLKFFVDKGEAEAFQDQAENFQGTEASIIEQLSGLEWQVFILEVSTGIKAVGTAGGTIHGANWMITANINFQRVNGRN